VVVDPEPPVVVDPEPPVVVDPEPPVVVDPEPRVVVDPELPVVVDPPGRPPVEPPPTVVPLAVLPPVLVDAAPAGFALLPLWPLPHPASASVPTARAAVS
jgi:hypothetical protein